MYQSNTQIGLQEGYHTHKTLYLCDIHLLNGDFHIGDIPVTFIASIIQSVSLKINQDSIKAGPSNLIKIDIQYTLYASSSVCRYFRHCKITLHTRVILTRL